MKAEDLDREGLHAFHGKGRLDRFILKIESVDSLHFPYSYL